MGATSRSPATFSWERYRSVLRLRRVDPHDAPGPVRGDPTTLSVQSYLWIVAYGVLPTVRPGPVEKRSRQQLKQKDYEGGREKRGAPAGDSAANAHEIGLLGERHCYRKERERLTEARQGRPRDTREAGLRSRTTGQDTTSSRLTRTGGERGHVEIKTTSWPKPSCRAGLLAHPKRGRRRRARRAMVPLARLGRRRIRVHRTPRQSRQDAARRLVEGGEWLEVRETRRA